MTSRDIGLEQDLRLVTRCSMPVLVTSSLEERKDTLFDCAAILKTALNAKRANNAHEYEAAIKSLTDYFAAQVPARTPAQVSRDFRLGAPLQVPSSLVFLDPTALSDAMDTDVDLTQNKLNPSPKKRE